MEKRSLALKGNFNKYTYYILDLGTHYTAYVEIPENHILYEKHYIESDLLDSLDVHGGITYTENHLLLPNETIVGWFIGWDYSHATDYHPIFNKKGKKWKIREILEEVLNVCEQLDEIQIKHIEKQSHETNIKQELSKEVDYWNMKYNEEFDKNKQLLVENKLLKRQLDYLRSGEYINQLKFERDMLQNIVDNMEK